MTALSRSRNTADPDIAFAHEFLIKLAGVEELFRFKTSDKTSLEDVFAEVYPEAEYLGENTRSYEWEWSAADHRYVFKSPDGALFYVFERDEGEVFIDVSDYATGEGGQAVYAAVANYAFNTRKVFIADPAGLTADSLIRRTSNMLSAAIRYGTTDYLDAAQQQIDGDRTNGVEPLIWYGDDLARTCALIQTFITTIDNTFSGLKAYQYDFQRRQFTDRRGRSIRPDRFAHLSGLEVARASRSGEGTIRRWILIKSLVSSSSGERPRILEQVHNGACALVSEGGLAKSF
jgi:hypothetical protein